MDNPVLECIRSRRSIRRYAPQQVEDDRLGAILEAAAWAPSGSNSQSWHFLVIQNTEVLATLNETLRKGFLRWTPDDDYPAKRSAVLAAQQEHHNYFYHAPTLIIFSNLSSYQNAMADCSCAIENLFLAAHSLGLGTCWSNALRWLRDDSGVRALLTPLGLPETHQICCAATVGYPDHAPPAPQRKKGVTSIIR